MHRFAWDKCVSHAISEDSRGAVSHRKLVVKLNTCNDSHRQLMQAKES